MLIAYRPFSQCPFEDQNDRGHVWCWPITWFMLSLHLLLFDCELTVFFQHPVPSTSILLSPKPCSPFLLGLVYLGWVAFVSCFFQYDRYFGFKWHCLPCSEFSCMLIPGSQYTVFFLFVCGIIFRVLFPVNIFIQLFVWVSIRLDPAWYIWPDAFDTGLKNIYVVYTHFSTLSVRVTFSGMADLSFDYFNWYVHALPDPL